MTLCRGGLVGACLAGALFAGGCTVLGAVVGGAKPSRDVEVSVAPEEMLVRFPAAADTSWACSAPAASGRLYAWTVQLDRDEPWHGIHVRAVLPPSAPDPGRSLAPILEHAEASVARMSGTPPTPAAAEDTPVTVFSVGDTAVVVRLTDRAAIRRVARGRPLSARLLSCVDGDDAWSRDVPVRYDPRF